VGYHADAYDDLQQYFGQVTVAQTFHADYMIPYENDNPIYICRDLKIPVDEMWKQMQSFS